MPANYAFHRFGAQALRCLPEHQQRPIRRFLRLYNGGLHGADLFFWFHPMMPSATGELYHTYHSMTGREFFAQACELLKQNPSEGGMACLYGLLANYCLNTQLTPLFREAMAGGNLSRTELEVELDRYLLSLDGKTPAHTQDLRDSLKMTRGECVTVSLFYPPVTESGAYSAYSSMMFWMKRMAAKKRGFTGMLLKAAKGTFAHQMMPDHANHKCLHLDSAMADCCQKALELYPQMARQLTAYREEGTPLGVLFEPSFH
jgi:hypothetical protein